MKKENNMNIIDRIIYTIKKIFCNDKVLVIEPSKEEKVSNTSKVIKELERENDILMLQKDFEQGIIKEEKMTKEQKDNLIKLYKEQIEVIEKNIDIEKEKLQDIKEKIIIAKQKLA